MNLIINIIFIIALFLFFQGSFEKKGIELNSLEIPIFEFNEFSNLFKSTPSCSDELVIKTVRDTIIKESKKKLELMSTLGNIFIPNETRSLENMENMINNKLVNSRFLLKHIRTTNKDKNIKKVFCSSDIEVFDIESQIEYTAQYTDDNYTYIEIPEDFIYTLMNPLNQLIRTF
jgi:hypothetical protein